MGIKDLELDLQNEDLPTWNQLQTMTPSIINPSLSPTQIQQIQDLLEEFQPLFSDTPGKVTGAEIHIRTGDAPPVHLPAYRISAAKYDIVRKEVSDLLQAGIITPSVSPWASPIILVPKPDDKWRLCVDYRRLNRVTVPDPFPMPRIDEMLDRIGGAKYISTVDLTKGYWQVPVAVDSQEKTAFVTPLGKYQFTTMPFGLAGAPSVFQRLMNSILADIPQYAAAYIDDVTIYSNSWEEHLSHLREVFLRLKARGLTIKAGKCQFGREEVSFLGHRVGRGRIRPSLAKIQDVANFTRPTTKKQIRAFLGLAGYYRKFIENFSHLTTPLSDLTKKDAPDKIV